jgi:hypothetical protein
MQKEPNWELMIQESSTHTTSIVACRFFQSSSILPFNHSANPRARCTAISMHCVISSKLIWIPPAFCKTQSVGEALEERWVRATERVDGRSTASRCVGSTIGWGLSARTYVSDGAEVQW